MSEKPTPRVAVTILRNTGWSVFAVLATPVLAFLFGGLTLRYLGLEKAGFSLSVAAVFGISGRFATFGMGQASLPALAAALGSGDTKLVSSLSGILFAVFAISSSLTAVAFIVAAPWFLQWVGLPVAPAEGLLYIVLCGLTHVLGQLSLATHISLRAANRYDLVTLVTAPLAFFTGLTACIILPVFPSLRTMAIVNLVSSSFGLLISGVAMLRATPLLLSWRPRSTEVLPLVRYGKWLLLGNLVSSCTSGVDELVITATCGPAAVPPWAIGKRLWLTVHTFLAQHIEHLVPLMSSLQGEKRDRLAQVGQAMHWYVMLVASSACIMQAWGGEAVVGVVAGEDVAAVCRPAIQSFSLFCICFALFIVPVTQALACGVSRVAFEVAATQQLAMLSSLCLITAVIGVPAAYYSPVLATPFLVIALWLIGIRMSDASPLVRWVYPVSVPMVFGIALIISAVVTGSLLTARARFGIGLLVAVTVVPGTIGLEWILGLNRAIHKQLREACGAVVDFALRRVRALLGVCEILL